MLALFRFRKKIFRSPQKILGELKPPSTPPIGVGFLALARSEPKGGWPCLVLSKNDLASRNGLTKILPITPTRVNPPEPLRETQ